MRLLSASKRPLRSILNMQKPGPIKALLSMPRVNIMRLFRLITRLSRSILNMH